MMRLTTLGGLVLAFALACAPPATTGKSETRNPNLITKDEITAANVYNAYDAVRVLRPTFLHSRGPTTLRQPDTGLPRVYLDHQFYGEIELLRQIDTKSIREIRFYNASEASIKFGLGNTSGVIEVLTDSQP
jgi:hypothetical protein